MNSKLLFVVLSSLLYAYHVRCSAIGDKEVKNDTELVDKATTLSPVITTTTTLSSSPKANDTEAAAERGNATAVLTTTTTTTTKPADNATKDVPTTTTTTTTSSTEPSSTRGSESATPVTPTSPTATAESKTVAAPTGNELDAKKDREFDGPSFIGGIVLAVGLTGIGFVVYKFCKARPDRSYRNL